MTIGIKMSRRKSKNAGRKGPSCVSKWGEKKKGDLIVNTSYVGLSAVPLVFSSLPPLDSLFSGGLLGEGPEQHITLGFRGCQHIMM